MTLLGEVFHLAVSPLKVSIVEVRFFPQMLSLMDLLVLMRKTFSRKCLTYLTVKLNSLLVWVLCFSFKLHCDLCSSVLMPGLQMCVAVSWKVCCMELELSQVFWGWSCAWCPLRERMATLQLMLLGVHKGGMDLLMDGGRPLKGTVRNTSQRGCLICWEDGWA